MVRQPYRPCEDLVIIASYQTHQIRQIARDLGRNDHAVRGRIYRLQRQGRLSVHDRCYQRPWADEDIEYVHEHYGTISDTVLAKRLGRTVIALEEKADRLGINRKMNLWTSRNVAELFGVDAKTVLRWLARGWIKGKQAPMRQGPHHVWNIDEESLERFVRTMGYAYDWTRMRRGDYLTNLAKETAKADPWLTLTEAARSIGWREPRLDRWVQRGILSHKRRPKQSQHGPWQNLKMIRKADLGPFLARYPQIVHANRSASARERMSRWLDARKAVSL